jgi:hypothetical protein
MSRLSLILLVFFSYFELNAQNEIKSRLKFVEELEEKGDYYYALKIYEEILNLDSTSIEVHWKYAESLRKYKDYNKAENEYSYVVKYDSTNLFPTSILFKGLMEKQNGKYEIAINTFKATKKKFMKDRRSYPYLKAKNEINSCLWAKSTINDSIKVSFNKLPETINTNNSEFGNSYKENILYFTSLRSDSIKNEEVYDSSYTTSIYSSLNKNNVFQSSNKVSSLKSENENIANGTISLDGNRLYYSKCSPKKEGYECVIMVSKKINNKWTVGDSLGEIINAKNSNTTMPSISKIDDKEVLFFASDREGTKGGLDIWYSFIKNGNQYSKVQSVRSINTIENEISPWFDTLNQTLYFSTSWYDGYGGYDIFYSNYTGGFEKPKNAGLPKNSPANDLYYFMDKDTFYLTSNRIGVNYTSVPTCCSDIFKGNPIEIKMDSSEKVKETLASLNKRLPITLYFHNDIPNPKTTDIFTNVNYIESYREYLAMLDIYKNEYSKGLKEPLNEEAKEDISDFFSEYVEQGVRDLELFRDLLLKELQKGRKFNLYIKGFASPLAKSDYNVNLTKRRINSLINYLSEYDKGIFKQYIDEGALLFNEIPFGENVANKLTSDNPNDVKNSIYSRAAAIERKIEIQSIELIEISPLSLTTSNQLYDMGVIKNGEISSGIFYIKNNSNQSILIEQIDIPCDCNQVEIEKMELSPREQIPLKLFFDSKNYNGKIVKSIYIKVKNQSDSLRLVMTGVVE